MNSTGDAPWTPPAVFVETMHVAEHEKAPPRCPRCEKKDKVEKRLSAFTAVTSRKSTGY